MAIMKNKAVVKLGVTDAKSKKAATKALVDIEGFYSVTLDLEKLTLVVMGDMDPTVLVHKLRKFLSAHLVTFGPEKDEVKLQKNNGGGGRNVDQKPQPPVYQPSNYGIGTSGYGYGYPYYYD